MSTGNRSLHMLRKSGGRRLVLLAIGLLVLVSPCAYCWWISSGVNWIFREMLPVYPAAQEISTSVGYEDAGTAIRKLYFWSQDSLEHVRSYYETLTPTFTEERYWFTPENRTYYQTTFNSSGEPLQQRHCDRQPTYDCVEVELVKFEADAWLQFSVSLSPWIMYATASPPSPDFNGGTLIIYRYYERDFSSKGFQ